ncbi:MAG: thymidylate synthase [archaeon GW2011_AR10]|uniref:Thymidylate synthase n=1 Tax=Candidatus Iainarchaeum sp. TaxID=3101447 RepID=A0A7J4IX51_9ARCH|nr:MAG: thymidylate synthase [archaeon GW2011_AR10]HIH08849.1 thymidylate synthase [Candidatus Diapherotrites archaeon]
MEQFSKEEQEILRPFFTNLDKPVFVLKNLPEVVKGALFSRYSRSDKSLRRVLLEEFIKDEKMGFKEIVGHQAESGVSQVVAIRKAEEFYDRVLVGFGDDSVAELGGAHVAVEDVSNITSVILEDSRIGLSPLEKSTRYVWYDKKVNGKYAYYSDEKIMQSRHADLFTETCDMLFDSYAELVEPTKKYLNEQFPQEENVSDRAYNSTIKAKTCDVLRVFLPAATTTNLGLFGNGRSFEYLLTKMYSNELTEPQNVAASMHAELQKVIPSFVKRARDQFGMPTIEFMHETRKGMRQLAGKIFEGTKPQKEKEVTLVSFDSKAEEKVVAAALYPFTDLSHKQVQEKVRKMNATERKQVLKEYQFRRQNRRHKPYRGFEHAYYEFDLLGNYGIYRDLHRHRMLTQQRQPLTVKHGFNIPTEFKALGVEEKYVDAMKEVASAFNAIAKDLPKEAQYVVPFGYRIRWNVCLNLRELYHLVELRSTIQGHPDYRRIAFKMFDEVRKVQPALVEWMKFVVTKDIGLERLEAEKEYDKRIEEVKKKYGG